MRPRPVPIRFTVPCKAKLPADDKSPSDSPKSGASPAPPSDSFSGFAAGPSSAAPPRIGRRSRSKTPTDSPPEEDTDDVDTSPASSEEEAQPSNDKSDDESVTPSDSSELSTKPATLDSLRAVRALGTTPAKETKSFSQRKTAADFIAEGVVDDVEESSPFIPADIRFGIDDIKDPFKEDSVREEEERVMSAQQQMEDAVGKAQDVTGDGGVSKTLLTVGSGPFATSGADVKVQYTGTLENGTEFDSSRVRGGGFSFTLGTGTVIKGWEAAISSMRIGEIASFKISPAYAYGRRGMPPVIPGNATLDFEIELLEVKGGADDNVKNMSDFNPGVARTPEEISKTYESRLKSKEERDKKMSLLERFYIISPFMSQTGEKPPWWINPNITFVLIAFFILLGTYLVVLSGAVHVGYVDAPVDVNIFK